MSLRSALTGTLATQYRLLYSAQKCFPLNQSGVLASGPGSRFAAHFISTGQVIRKGNVKESTRKGFNGSKNPSNRRIIGRKSSETSKGKKSGSATNTAKKPDSQPTGETHGSSSTLPSSQESNCSNKTLSQTMFTFTTITRPSSDTKHPLLLLQSINGERYLFGKVSEGAQRATTENKIKISKMSNIFLTGELNWSSVGGLPGMILTIADQGKEKLCINYGTRLIDYVVSTWRYFVFRFGIDLSTRVLTHDPSSVESQKAAEAIANKSVQTHYKDKLIQVNSIILSPDNGTSSDTPAVSANPFNSAETAVLESVIKNMFPKGDPSSTKYDPSSDPYVNVCLPRLSGRISQSSTSYEILFNSIRGRFKVDEAIRLGVPKGPLFAQLTRGESVTLEDGTVVHPHQVLEEERKFPKVLVLDIPSDQYIESFKKHFEKYDGTNLGAVYYFLGEDVTLNEGVVQLMDLLNRNSNTMKHIISHHLLSKNTITFVGSAITTLKLKALQPDSYNLPKTSHEVSKSFLDCFGIPPPGEATIVNSQESKLYSVIPSENIQILQKNSSLDILTISEDCPSGCSAPKVSDKSAKGWMGLYKAHIEPLNLPIDYNTLIENEVGKNHFNSTESKRGHVELVTLGTGSALPSKYRNVISTLIKIPHFSVDGSCTQRYVLFDAGENTIGQLNRMFSSTELRGILGGLSLIYLSHLHADHHLGIVTILREWYHYNRDNLNAKIYLVTPWQYNNFLKEWFALESPEILSRIIHISCEHLINDKFVRMETKSIGLENYYETFIMGKSRAPKRRKLELDRSSSFRDISRIRSMYKDLGIVRFQTCRAIHCNWAYSNAITFKISPHEDFKISYSGDTRPNIERFALEIGQRSDLLIHEATLDNDLQEDAIKKKHCTLRETVEVANAMNVRKVVLTHFSQRYPKVPQFESSGELRAEDFCFAFDGMIIDYERLGEQKKVLSQLASIFKEEAKEVEEEDKQH